jgi:threonine aldolase
VIDQARAWRKRHGGTLYGMWPNAASGLAGLRLRLPRMARYVDHAQAIAKKLRHIANVEIVPDPPQTNMMHLHLRVDEQAFKAAAVRIARERSIFTWPGSSPGSAPSTRIVEFTVGDATLAFQPAEVAGLIAELVQAGGRPRRKT